MRREPVGAFCCGNRINGGWKVDELKFHINYLELLAVFLGLKSFASTLTNCTILLRVDNRTAIIYVNRMGGIQFPHLNNLARDIWQWCEVRNIWLFASYINFKENTEADKESRKINPDIEWELSDCVFQHIIDTLGQPKIDLFASRTNTKCDTFISWKKDPDFIAVDAFTVNWQQWQFYAFPPFSLILKCIRKIIDDSASGILVLISNLAIAAVISTLNEYSSIRYNHSQTRREFVILTLVSGVITLCTNTLHWVPR